MSNRSTSILVFVVSVAVSPALFAHPDDPKIYDRQPPYDGPGYRAALRDNPPAFPAVGLTLQSWIPVTEFNPGFSAANDCWGYVAPSGREYAIIGLSGGTSFVEITNPGNAQIVQTLSGPTSTWRDIKVYQDHAYAVSEGGSGIQVFDLSQIDSGSVTLVNTVTTGGSTTATHNVAIDTVSGYLYRTGGSNEGLRIYDLSNPSTPVYVTSWTDRYVHDAQIVTYTDGPYAGRQIAFCSSGFNGGWDETGVDILDVTDKGNIFQVSRLFYSGPQYSHQLWLSPDRRFLYLDDELDEQTNGTPTTTRVLDVSDLEAPFEATEYTNGNTSIDHNLYTRGSMIFAANYRSGLRVFDATDQLAPVEVAFYDTYAANDSANFNGLWSNYPYFPSGTIIGSDIERGLFVWTLESYPLSVYYPTGRPAEMPPGGLTLRVEFTENVPGALDAGTPTLHYDDGSGPVSAPLTPLGGNSFEAAFPDAPCDTVYTYYITAASTTAIPVSSPVDAPGQVFTLAVVADETTIAGDDFETAAGWSVNLGGGDTATTGIWIRGDPIGTAAQPENDHTPTPGSQCWFTGQGSVGGGLGENDIDGGITTLTSANYDATGIEDPHVSFWLWYSNSLGAAPNADTFEVEISDNGGAFWIPALTVGPAGPGTAGSWLNYQLRVLDFVGATTQLRLRFTASDLADGSIVEAAVDDLAIVEVTCSDPTPCLGDVDGSGVVDLTDLAVLLANFGLPSGATPADGDLDGDADVDLTDLAILLSNFDVVCG